MNPNAEPQPSVERFSVGKNKVTLGNQNDAVCDGKSMKLRAIERSNPVDKTAADKQKRREGNADALAKKVNTVVKPTKPVDAARLLNLSTELENLTKGRFSGLIVNIQSNKNTASEPDAASIGMVVFIDYLAEHQSDTSSNENILLGAYAAVQRAYTTLKFPGEPSFAAALLTDKGELMSICSTDMFVLVANDVEVKKANDALSTIPQTYKVANGDKIIICNPDDANTHINESYRGKDIFQFVDGLSNGRDAEREEKPIAENIINTRHATFFPDLHGGKDLNDPKRKGTDSPLADFVKNPREGELYVSLGDIFDRGPKSWEAAELMKEMVMKGEAVWSWGNHELLFMATMSGDKATSTPENAQALETWFVNGGFELAKGAGVDMKVFNDAVTAAGGNEALFSNAAARKACLAQMLPLIRADKNLQALSGVLEKHGKAYTIVDNVLGTHAGFLANPDGTLMDVMIGTANFGKGLNAMDAIQKEIRNGNPDVINWLANHGGSDALNKGNPFWVREENFQNVLKDPKTASALRAELNKQLPSDQQIELIVVGHTPMADVVKGTIPLNGAPPAPRFLFADTGYCDNGDPRAVRLEVKSDKTGKKGDSVEVIYIDPVTGKEVESSPGVSVLHTFYPTGKNLPRRISHSVAGESVHAENSLGSPIKIDPLKPNEPIIVPDNKRYVDVEENPISVADYIKTKGYEEYKKWIETVIDEINNSTSPDPDVVALKKGATEDPLIYTKRVVQALKEHLSEEGKNKDSDISRIAKEAEVAAKVTNPMRAVELVTLDAVANILNSSVPGLYDEALGPKELLGNKESTKAAFVEAFALYKTGMAALVAKAEADPNSLSAAEKEQVAQYKYTEYAYTEAQKRDDWKMRVELRAHGRDDSQHFVYEGIPVEGVMRYLEAKIAKDLLAYPSADVAADRKLLQTLTDRSKFYRQFTVKERLEEEPKRGSGIHKFITLSSLLEARHQLEAKERSVDDLRKNTNPNDVDRMQGDWDQGVKDMSVRRELYFKEGEKPDLGVVRRKRGVEDAEDVLENLADAPREKKNNNNDEDDEDNTAPLTSKKDPKKEPPVISANDLQVNMVIAAENGHYIHSNNNNTDHMMSREQGVQYRGPLKAITSIPLVGGVFKTILNPVQFLWRNNLARESVREQNRRFVDRMNITLKSNFMAGDMAGEVVKGQMRIPVELTSQLLDKALIEGRALRSKKNIFSRMGWGIADFVAHTTTLGETSEMRFAKQWLESQLLENEPGSRDPSIESIFQRSLTEQDAVASRIALGGLRRGERRDKDPIQNSPLQQPIKTAISDYFARVQAVQTDTDIARKNRVIAEARTLLVASVNSISKSQGANGSVAVDKGIELVSNILSVVKDLEGKLGDSDISKWQALQEQEKWDEFKINVFTAESRWGAEGGAESPMGSLREGILKRMAEKELFHGENERTHGIGLASISIASEAFALGAASSLALFGTNALSRMALGLGGVMGSTVVKEMGVRIGGTQLLRGRYRGEVAQVSREIALGKKNPAELARIRKEMSGALVDASMMQNAGDIAGRVEGLNGKKAEEMTEADAYKLLREIAQLDARMRIADISGSKDLQFGVQNYIIYDELNRNEQYLRLKSGVLEGLKKLEIYKHNHADFGWAANTDVSTGTQIKYGESQGALGLFEKFSILAEAQLRVGSTAEVMKWLTDENMPFFNNNAGLGMSKEEAKSLMKAFYSKARGAVNEQQSIRSKEKTLRKLATKRAATMVLQSALIMPISGVIYGAEAQVLSGISQEAQHVVREGFATWSKDWGDLLSGKNLTSPSLFQSGVLAARHTVDSLLPHQPEPIPPVPQPEATPTLPHDEVINGVHVQLPGSYKIENNHIIDTRDGRMVQDLSQTTLQVDNNNNLIATNAAGNQVALPPEFQSAQHGTTPETILLPQDLPHMSYPDENSAHTVHIPEGTHWVNNTDGHSYNLVVTGHPDVVLVDHAHIDAQGQLTAEHFNSAEQKYIPISTGGDQSVNNEGVSIGSLWSRAETVHIVPVGDPSNHGVWHDSTFNTSNPDHPFGVEIRFPEATFHNPNTGADQTLASMDAQGNVGFLFNIPGIGQGQQPGLEGFGQVFIRADRTIDTNGQTFYSLRLDPSDTSNVAHLHDGSTIPMGQLAQIILNEAKVKQHVGEHGVGTLDSQIQLDTRAIYNLAHDGKNGDIIGGGFDEQGKYMQVHEIKGTSPVNEDGIIIPSPVAQTTVNQPVIEVQGEIRHNVPLFVVSESPLLITPPPPTTPDHFNFTYLPIPMGRVNVEAAESGITASTAQVVTNSALIQNNSPTQDVVPTIEGVELTEQEKQQIKREVEASASVSAPLMMKELGLKKGKNGDFGTYVSENQKKESNARHAALEQLLVTYESAIRTFDTISGDTTAVKVHYQDARKKLIEALKHREGRLFGRTSSFDKQQIEMLDIFIAAKRKELLDKKMDDKLKKKMEEKEKEKVAAAAIEQVRAQLAPADAV